MPGGLKPVEPILCAHLLRRVDGKLVELLRSLEPAEWDRQTVAPLWKVRDVAAHLLDTALRKLSLVRDGSFVSNNSAENVVTLVNRLNAEGVTVYRRLSPRLLMNLMENACEQSARFHEALDPFDPAAFNVSWAGEQQSLNWFDTARELTERWHHQQQIRLAVNRPGIMTPELYSPVLDCFLRGLPHHYREIKAAEGTCVHIEITDDCGGSWFLLRTLESWHLTTGKGSNDSCASHVIIPQELAWQLFTKAKLDRSQHQINGNPALGEKTLQFTAIVG